MPEDLWTEVHDIVKTIPKKKKCKKAKWLSEEALQIAKKRRREKGKGKNETVPIHMDIIKDRNGIDLTEAEDIKKRWQEHTEELYKKRSSLHR